MQNTTILCKYVMHTNVLTYFMFAVTYAVNKYLFKYFKYAKAYLIHMCTFYIHHGLPMDVTAHMLMALQH